MGLGCRVCGVLACVLVALGRHFGFLGFLPLGCGESLLFVSEDMVGNVAIIYKIYVYS